ncbi:hypothetical protein IKF15_03870 [Candidatus Saccharibacteria bacterium]|nr:hypothetical protein [Candidatus Saccharibacteria bacterium]
MEYGSPIQNWFARNKRRLILTLVIAAISISAIFIAIFIIKTLKSSELLIVVAPTSAKVKINGKTYQNGNYKFFPGKIVAEISHDELETKTVELELKANETHTLQAYLVGKDNDFSYYKKSSEDFELLKLVGDKNVAPFVNKWQKDLTLRDILPIYNTRYEHGQRVIIQLQDASSSKKCTEMFCILARSGFSKDSETFDETNRVLKEEGYDIYDYQILYEE